MSRIINRVRGIRGSFRPGQVVTTPTRGTRGPAQLSDINTLASQLGAAGVGSGAAGNGLPSGGSNGQVLAKVAGAVAWTFTTAITAVGTIATGVWQGTKIALAYGGTNADLSATGGSGQVLKQDSAGGNVTVGLITILGTIATGVWQGTKIALGYGGTNADLSATGGAHKFLRQNSVGAAIDVVQPDFSDLASTISTHLVAGTNITITGTDPATINATGGGSTTLAGDTDVNISSPSNNQVLTYQTSDNKWHNVSPGTGGTVTSVAMTVPAELSVAGSPVTTSGTLAVTWAAQADNKILANITGGSSVPSFSTVTAVLDHALGSTNDKLAIRRSGSWTQDQISALLTAGTGITLTGTTNVTVSGAYVAGSGISISGATISNTGASGSPGGSSDFIAPIYGGGPPSIMRAFGEQSVDGAPGTGPAGTGPVGLQTIQWATPKQKGDFVSWDGARFVNSHYVLSCMDPQKAVATFGDPANNVLFLANTDGASTSVNLVGFGTGTLGVPALGMFRANGTSAAPTGLQTSDVIFRFTGAGFGSTISNSAMRISGRALEAWTDTAVGARFLVEVCATGTTTFSTVFEGRTDGCIIQGTNTNNNAAAGKIGEYTSSSIAVGSAVVLASATAANITSISLTAGDWDVWGNACYISTGVVETDASGWISSTSATDPGAPNSGAYAAEFLALNYDTPTTTGEKAAMPVGQMRLSLSGTTTVYLSTLATNVGGGLSAYGFIGARRKR